MGDALGLGDIQQEVVFSIPLGRNEIPVSGEVPHGIGLKRRQLVGLVVPLLQIVDRIPLRHL